MILVTGSTGLVGSHLLYSLSKENKPLRALYRTEEKKKKTLEVFGLYTNKAQELFNKIEWIKADITDITTLDAAFDGIDVVYHCAAYISFKEKDYFKLRNTNIHGSANVVNYAVSHGIKKLCFVSSIAAIGDDPKKKFVDEENEWNGNENNHGYAITKYGAEMEVWRGSQEGLEVVIVNPGVIIGPGFWNDGSGKLFSRVFNGLKYYTNGGSGFVSVQDVVNAMIQLTRSNVKNERFILVSENKTYKDVLLSIADSLGVKRPFKEVKPWKTEVVWRVNSFFSLFGFPKKLSKHSAKSLHTVTLYDSNKIKEKLNFEFTLIDESIKTTAKYYPKK